MKFQKIIPIFLCFTNCVNLQCMEKDNEKILKRAVSNLAYVSPKIRFIIDNYLSEFFRIYCENFPAHISKYDDICLDRFKHALHVFSESCCYNNENLSMEKQWREFLRTSRGYKSISPRLSHAHEKIV